MDENLSRGYCQLLDPPRGGSRSGGRSGRVQDDPDDLAPVDKCSCIYMALILCGAGFLLPYNSFITAVDYYQDKYPNTTIIFDMSLTYICLALVSVILNNVFVELLPLQARITFGYVISFVTLLLIGVLDIRLQWFSPEVSYTMTLVAVGTVSVGCTVQQSSFYGYTSMLPARYTQAVMVGESMAGLIISINRILTKALMPQNVTTNTLIFFIISMVMILCCCVTFHVSMRSQFARYHVALCQSAGVAEDQRGIVQANNPEEVDIMDGHVSRDNYGVLVIQSPTTPPGEQNTFQHSQNTAPPPTISDVVIRDSEALVKGQGHSYKAHISKWHAIKRGCISRFHVSKLVWPYMISIGMAYCVTLCLFPGIESEVISCSLGSWMPVLLISVFNLFDFIGKIMASATYDWPRAKLVMLTFCRVILVPLLMLCAAPRDKPLIRGEFWPFLFSILLGISNGYFGSVPMILAPGKVSDELKELTGNIMTLSYSVGLTTGSAVAYLLDEWLGPRLEQTCAARNLTSLLLSGYDRNLNRTYLEHLLPFPSDMM